MSNTDPFKCTNTSIKVHIVYDEGLSCSDLIAQGLAHTFLYRSMVACRRLAKTVGGRPSWMLVYLSLPWALSSSEVACTHLYASTHSDIYILHTFGVGVQAQAQKYSQVVSAMPDCSNKARSVRHRRRTRAGAQSGWEGEGTPEALHEQSRNWQTL